jgi:hypothetical protein
MKTPLMAAAATLIGLAALAPAAPASAAIVCSGDACWHVHGTYHYPPNVGIVVHSDHWRWGPHDHYVWHEHRGRGYWRNGVWVTF